MAARLPRRGRRVDRPLRHRPVGAGTVESRRGYVGRFPLGILLINVLGSFVLGLLTGAASHGLGPLVLAFVATGVCGGFTTFSTWAYDTVRLSGGGDRMLATANVAVTVTGGMLAAAAGLGLALL